MRLSFSLPTLFEAQQRMLVNHNRFNIMAIGEKGGKTQLGIEVLLAGERSVLGHKQPGCWLCSSTVNMGETVNRIISALGRLMKRRASETRIELVNGNYIDIFPMDQEPRLFNRYSVVIVDDASEINGLVDYFYSDIRPALQYFNGECWIMGVPRGKQNDFWRLYDRAERMVSWYRDHCTSFDNPFFPDEEAESVDTCTEDELKQRYLAEFLEHSIEMSLSSKVIRPGETFLNWCLRLQAEGLKVDGHPFRLDNRQSLHEIYDQIPTTIEQAYKRTLVLQKGAQMGLTVFEQLADIYMAVKFAPCKVLMYLPDRGMAGYKSSERFMPIVRTIPDVHSLFGSAGKKSDGNTLTRVMPSLGSNFLFLWTSGKAGGTTESFPGDVLSLDETQGMTLEQIDRVRERLSASRIRFVLMLSTPLLPELDINQWFLMGDQRKFHSDCGCEEGVILTDMFLEAALQKTDKIPVVFNAGQFPDAPNDFVYYCPNCGQYIEDPQKGHWVPHNPGSEIISYHMSQILSPTVTPKELRDAYYRADTADRRQNFFCRKLGSPYSDPSQVPVNLPMLMRCVDEGLRRGVVWKKHAENTFAGVDQMGSFCCLFIAERLPDGRMAIIHAEAIYHLDPWSILDQRMRDYGIRIMVLEQLPNIDSARQFAKRHEGKVFLITSYGNLADDMVVWGDAPETNKDQKTDDEFRVQYTIRADQFKVMSWAFARIAEQFIVFPDPDKLISEIREHGEAKQGAVLKEMCFYHFTKTGLVIETDDEQRKTTRKVVKIGIDPHFSFALMALSMAWFRAFGTTSFILPDAPTTETRKVQGLDKDNKLPTAVVNLFDVIDETYDYCGDCVAFDRDKKRCNELEAGVQPRDEACSAFIRRKQK